MALMLTPKIETELRAITLELLREKRGRASIGPADIARRFKPDDWSRWMDTVKEVARRLADEGKLEVTRHGKPITTWPWRGVIRFRNPLAKGAEPAGESESDESGDEE
jgi:hypothetical protein